MKITFEKPRFIYKRGEYGPVISFGGLYWEYRKHYSKSISFQIYFEKRDIWIGCYWNARNVQYIADRVSRPLALIDIYLIAIPMFPLKITYHHHYWSKAE